MSNDSWVDTTVTYGFESGLYGEYSEFAGSEEIIKLFPERHVESSYEDDQIQTAITDFKTVDASTLVATTQSTPVRYRMRGYFVAGSTYEFWVTTSPSSPNPSGNPLVSVTVDSILSQ